MDRLRAKHYIDSAAAVHSWLRTHLPHTCSPLGHDTFMLLAEWLILGETRDMRAATAALPYPPGELGSHIGALSAAGLLVLDYAGCAEGNVKLVPTAALEAQVEAYFAKLDSLFIARVELRERRLCNTIGDPGLHALAARLYDEMFDADLFYLHYYGAMCFAMAAFSCRLAQRDGHRARVEVGYAIIESPAGGIFRLGAQGYSKPGEIEAHAVCVIDEAVLLDFGLGNVRRGYRRDFYWGLACDYRPQAGQMARVVLPTGETVTWNNDWVSPDAAAELARVNAHIDAQLAQAAKAARVA